MDFYIDLESEGFSEEEFVDIKQCLETLFSIRAGSQPLDRNLGIDMTDILGAPMNVAQNTLALEIIEKVDIYEPRVEVDKVDFEADAEGQIRPYVHLVKREQEESEEEE